MDHPVRILVVCAGNTCRSPAAEAAIRREAKDLSIPVLVSSAAVYPVPDGQAVNPQMRAAGAKRGLEIDGAARQVTGSDISDADLVLAVDVETQAALSGIGASPTGDIGLLAAFDPQHPSDEIADPFGRSDDVYAETLSVIVRSARGLVQSLMARPS